MLPALEPLLLDADGAGRYLACSRSTIYELIERGELRGVKIGRARRFPLTELQALVERLREVEAGR